ncbi:MAG: peptidoglycan DD-metalloendopeptidase family protein [Candidatus Limivicinus sp.]|nr:peptidoglycan DD-metalloendopeptidase family protein [Clostridiales bacterium]MDY6131996.1 peptidoglycan DD-metalloendopeptidase family protein [Candidatus Limivicinus sp.]
MKKKTKSLLALILSVVTVLSLVLGALPTRAYAVTQSEIDALKKERDKIAEAKAAQQAIVDELEARHADVLERKLALDDRNVYTLEQMELNEQEIALYDQMIEEKAREVDDARALEEQQLERYRTRVRAMEENGNYGFLALVLNAGSLGELLTAMDDIGEIMESDRRLEDEYIAAREHTEEVKAEYEAYKAELEAKQATLRAEQVELQRQIDEATDLINQLLEDIEGNAEELAKLQAAQDEAQKEIDQKVAELERQRAEEEERRRQEAAANNPSSGGGGSSGGSVTGTGSFTWPCPSCTYITSRVGYRWHPVSGQWKYHSGLDIGAAYGASIVAADGGTVTIAGVNGGYGNCVMIDHGNGYYTLYGHMSSIAVSVGQSVSKGATIGYVGSTGVSTGPHLHFEIRQGTTILDPENWFTGLTYAPDAGE